MALHARFGSLVHCAQEMHQNRYAPLLKPLYAPAGSAG